MKARLSTNANTIGAWAIMASLKSFEPAVTPSTATSAPGSRPTVAGTTWERRTSSERSEAASVPLPLTESATTATVLSGLISTCEGSESCPVASAPSCNCLIAAWTGAAVTSSALMTVVAGGGAPGEGARGRGGGWVTRGGGGEAREPRGAERDAGGGGGGG